MKKMCVFSLILAAFGFQLGLADPMVPSVPLVPATPVNPTPENPMPVQPNPENTDTAMFGPTHGGPSPVPAPSTHPHPGHPHPGHPHPGYPYPGYPYNPGYPANPGYPVYPGQPGYSGGRWVYLGCAQNAYQCSWGAANQGMAYWYILNNGYCGYWAAACYGWTMY